MYHNKGMTNSYSYVLAPFLANTTELVSIDWANVENKPEQFSPSFHTHEHNELDGLQGGSPDDLYHLTLAQVEELHTHDNKAVLDLLTDEGSPFEFLAADGEYKEIPVPAHNELEGLQGGDPFSRYHLSNAEKALLTDAQDATTMHHHDSRYALISQLEEAINTTFANYGSPVRNFTSLEDVPEGYEESALKLVRVNGTEDGLEFISFEELLSPAVFPTSKIEGFPQMVVEMTSPAAIGYKDGVLTLLQREDFAQQIVDSQSVGTELDAEANLLLNVLLDEEGLLQITEFGLSLAENVKLFIESHDHELKNIKGIEDKLETAPNGAFLVAASPTTQDPFNMEFLERNTDNVPEGYANLYWTASRSRNSVGASSTDTVDLVYNELTGVFEANVVPGKGLKNTEEGVAIDTEDFASQLEGSIVVNTENGRLRLLNDEASPAVNTAYAVDEFGSKGWKPVQQRIAVYKDGELVTGSFKSINVIGGKLDVQIVEDVLTLVFDPCCSPA